MNMRKFFLFLMVALPMVAGAQTTAPMGIFVSQQQGTVDWPAVREQNDLEFVYIMATTGATIVDSRCLTNMVQAQQTGMPLGCGHRYDRHFSAQGQFDNFKATVKGCQMNLAPAVMVVPDNPYDLNVKRLDMLLGMMEKEYGVKPLIMTSQEAYLKYFSLERYGAYHVIIVTGALKFPSTRYTFWQYTDKEKVAGIMEYVPGLKLHLTYKLADVKM